MKYLFRLLDLNRILNNLFGVVQVRIGIARNEHDMVVPMSSGMKPTEEQLINSTVDIVIKPVLGKLTGVGMSMESLVHVMHDIQSIPPNQRYDAVFKIQHPNKPEHSFVIESWAIPKLYEQAKIPCTSYSILRILKDSQQALEQAASSVSGEEGKQEDIKPIIH